MAREDQLDLGLALTAGGNVIEQVIEKWTAS
jgi:hypothetical protein